ncbi:MAG: hypothetical protein JSU63_02670 [Phycisphaerales bacterium]|nr:MAG: hypothetical protein JSU63_02670 [Phycisphaerales bacterium]
MLEVEKYLTGAEYHTDLWAATENVVNRMEKLAKKKRDLVVRFRGLLKRAAKVGFDQTADRMVRPEGNGIYAIGDRHGPLLRAAGFYAEDTRKQTFVLMEFYEKSGKENKKPQRDILRRIAEIRDNKGWRLIDE